MNMTENRGTPPNFPCNSQTVERAVKLTFETSRKAVSLSKRNNLFLQNARAGLTENVLRPKKTTNYNFSKMYILLFFNA